MSSFRVVEALYVVEHIRPGVVPGSLGLASRPFGFERGEEALHRRIIPDVARPAHRAGDAMIGHQPLELLGAVLGVFNRSSQHWVYWPDFRYSFKASLGVFQPSVFRGLLFSA